MSNQTVKSNLFSYGNGQQRTFTLKDVHQAEENLVLELYRFAMRGGHSGGVEYESELFVRVLSYSAMPIRQLNYRTKQYTSPISKYGTMMVTLGRMACMTNYKHGSKSRYPRMITVPTTLLDQILDYNAIVCEYLSQQDYIDGLNKGNYWEENSAKFNSVPEQKPFEFPSQFYTPETVCRINKVESESQPRTRSPEDDYRNYKHWFDPRPEINRERPQTASRLNPTPTNPNNTKTVHLDSKYLTDFLNGIVDDNDSVDTNINVGTSDVNTTKTVPIDHSVNDPGAKTSTNRKIHFNQELNQENSDSESDSESDCSDYTDTNDPVRSQRSQRSQQSSKQDLGSTIEGLISNVVNDTLGEPMTVDDLAKSLLGEESVEKANDMLTGKEQITVDNVTDFLVDAGGNLLGVKTPLRSRPPPPQGPPPKPSKKEKVVRRTPKTNQPRQFVQSDQSGQCLKPQRSNANSGDKTPDMTPYTLFGSMTPYVQSSQLSFSPFSQQPTSPFSQQPAPSFNQSRSSLQPPPRDPRDMRHSPYNF